TPTPTPTPTPEFDLPRAEGASDPAQFGFTTDVEVDGVQVDSFVREEPINFDKGETYPQIKGIVTFRGNNFRDNAAYGTATVVENKLSQAWEITTGEMLRGDVDGPTDRTWSGSGWVGQPLIVEWPAETRKVMNMYDWAKNKDGLVEVIYATLQGKVYFLDLETGEATRNTLDINMPFKGAGALDPRGYPILYLGSGDMYASDHQKTRAMAYSLIDFTRLYEFGKQNDPFAIRGWHAYDSSPLVDAKTDTLIYPGENGILYTVKLNTIYDAATGYLSINPSPMVKMRYNTSRSSAGSTSSDSYWLGYEASIATWGGYGYISSNDGFMQCIDLNTMDIVWATDIGDDANGSPVLEPDLQNRTAYLYAGVSSHFKKDKQTNVGTVGFFKIDAVTGRIVWKDERSVTSQNSVSGGIQATALLGKNSISDLVIVPYANTYGELKDGELVAYEKATGNVRWTYPMSNYTWSSPVAIYDQAGNAYIVVADNIGIVHLINGQTGRNITSFNAGHNCEASPAVYNNMIVIGTRGMKIYGIRLS
ncbi:MAG: PQQ-binding-like beta-propeller repeat protein, partial [Clostridia bacterium]|nr:PQQ-binding-like beta-propeller repeat protein [Clostridia bacterium]